MSAVDRWAGCFGLPNLKAYLIFSLSFETNFSNAFDTRKNPDHQSRLVLSFTHFCHIVIKDLMKVFLPFSSSASFKSGVWGRKIFIQV